MSSTVFFLLCFGIALAIAVVTNRRITTDRGINGKTSVQQNSTSNTKAVLANAGGVVTNGAKFVLRPLKSPMTWKLLGLVLAIVVIIALAMRYYDPSSEVVLHFQEDPVRAITAVSVGLALVSWFFFKKSGVTSVLVAFAVVMLCITLYPYRYNALALVNSCYNVVDEVPMRAGKYAIDMRPQEEYTIRPLPNTKLDFEVCNSTVGVIPEFVVKYFDPKDNRWETTSFRTMWTEIELATRHDLYVRLPEGHPGFRLLVKRTRNEPILF